MANNHKRLDDFFQKPSQEPEELKKYYEDLNKGIDPSKQTVTDRVAMFFKNLVERASIFYKKDKKEYDVEVKDKSRLRHKITVYYRYFVRKFIELFNFESEVDILDNTSVLYQRNKVNRRIRCSNLSCTVVGFEKDVEISPVRVEKQSFRDGVRVRRVCGVRQPDVQVKRRVVAVKVATNQRLH